MSDNINKKNNKIITPAKTTEYIEQVALFAWCFYMSNKYKELSLMFAIPNGAKLPYGKTKKNQRFSHEALKLLKSGLKPGVPDIFLPVARDNYHGLFIELKVGKNKPTDKQIEMIKNLKAQGYAVEICYGFENAKKVICEYLHIKE